MCKMLIKMICTSGMLVTRLGSQLRTGVRMFRTSDRVFRDSDPRQRLQFRTSGLKEVASPSAAPTLAQRLEWMTTMPGRKAMAMWAGWGGTMVLGLGCWCYYIAFQELFVHEYCLERDKDSLKALSPVLSSEFQVSWAKKNNPKVLCQEIFYSVRPSCVQTWCNLPVPCWSRDWWYGQTAPIPMVSGVSRH